MSKVKIIIVLTVFIDVLGMGIIIPVLPFYVESFGMSPIGMTMLFSVFALCAFFSSPLLGRMSDIFGRRPALLISLLSTAIGWMVFAGAKNVLWLFIGRIIDGVAAGNIPIAQGYLSDISKDAKERAANLGIIGAVFGIAFMVGPAIGGFLGSINHSLPFWLVGFLALANTIVGYFVLPETNKPAEIKEKSKISFNPFSPIIGVFKDKVFFSAYFVWFLFGVALSLTQSIFSLYLNKAFGFQENVAGLVLTAIGVIIALNQGVGLKHFWLKHFAEAKLELWFLIVFAIGAVMQGLGMLSVFIIGLVMTTFAQGVLRVVMNSLIISQKDRSVHGETMGVLSSIASLSMIIGPIFGGWLFVRGIGLPFFFSSIIALIGFILVLINRKTLSKVPLSEELELIEEAVY